MSYNVQYCGPMNVFDAVPLEADSTSAIVISQVESQALNLGTQMNYKSSGGQIYRTFAGIMGQMPKFSCVTECLAQFLTAFGIEGKILTTGIEQYNTVNDAASGKRGSGSVHEKLAFVKCLVIPRSLSCNHKGIAKLSFDVIGISADGTTSPVILTGQVALPAIAGVTEQYTLGGVKLNGTFLDGIQEVSIDFGCKEMMKSGSADVFVKLACLTQIEPKITIKTDDQGTLNALTLIGASTSSSTVIYLAKCFPNGIRIANGTAVHIGFTVNAGLWIPMDKGGSHPGILATGFECEPIYDGTHSPIVVSAAAVIA